MRPDALKSVEQPILPEHPEVNALSNVVKDGRSIGGLGTGEAV